MCRLFPDFYRTTVVSSVLINYSQFPSNSPQCCMNMCHEMSIRFYTILSGSEFIELLLFGFAPVSLSVAVAIGIYLH